MSSFDINATKRAFANALNRTLTKIANEQKKMIQNDIKVKKKYLNTRRLKRIRAKPDDLSIKITSTKKYITPFMLEKNARPHPNGYYELKNKNGGKFYGTRKKGVSVSGWSIGKGRISGSAYYYVQKISDLDDALLNYTEGLKKKAEIIFTQEIKKDWK
ncbi:hypothetical protein [Campylobacter hyointestinalis]|uniref:hypothetical protein n=1 Tax=Campylobacter hyointestinalis TaxID=198 RepID=UPI000726251E|nr:hypothetical protein [Campylobacter hyointestinalis]PPB63084.1 hypothetical protein CDQ72_01415 [Campylobacter hyointestinalis subsp. hyointestinalis]PPB65354.1 hypothetical protein CDQ73_01165 [Campylobacter hyointestinalis subsp. hyointestinalis]CUU72371.1 Uncharacterised protein [Campylobacter hyointestinalis subsp. hyointestinalis]